MLVREIILYMHQRVQYSSVEYVSENLFEMKSIETPKEKELNCKHKMKIEDTK